MRDLSRLTSDLELVSYLAGFTERRRDSLRAAIVELRAVPALEAERDRLLAEVALLRARKPGLDARLPAVVSPSGD